MSKRIFIVYGHHNTKKCFNQEIRDTFISEAKKLGHEIDLINLHEENQYLFMMDQNLVSKFQITEIDQKKVMFYL